MKPISLQPHTVRELTKDGGHVAVIDRLAEIGYVGIETDGANWGYEPKEFKAFLNDRGMCTSSLWGNLRDIEELKQMCERAQIAETPFVTGGFWIDDFATVDAIKKTADVLHAGSVAAQEMGCTICVHNHWMEFQPVDGKHAVDHLVEFFPEVKLEIDMYWAAAHGANKPEEMIAKHASRCPLIHVKDGPMVEGKAMVAVGSGAVDMHASMKAVDQSVTQWLIVELDKCDTDMMTAVEESYAWLVGNGYAEGNKPVG